VVITEIERLETLEGFFTLSFRPKLLQIIKMSCQPPSC